MLSVFKIWIVVGLATVMADHGALKSCYECAKGPKNYMCDWGDTLQWNVACCKEGSKSIYCQVTEKNKCSPTVENAGGMFYTYCPQITNTKCGTKATNMSLTATPAKQTLEKNGLQRINAGQQDACYYIIETPQYLYNSGTLKLKIVTMKNMALEMFTGPKMNEIKAAALAEENSIDFSNLVVLVATPDEGQTDTQLKFEYELTGTSEIGQWRKLYIENFTTKEGQRLLYIYGTCAVFLICLLCCGMCTCMYYCCCKPKVIDDPNMPGRRFSRRKSSRGSSLRASIRRSMRLESIVNRSGQSFRLSSKSIRRQSSKFSLADKTLPGAAKIIRMNDEEAQQMEDPFQKKKDLQNTSEPMAPAGGATHDDEKLLSKDGDESIQKLM